MNRRRFLALLTGAPLAAVALAQVTPTPPVNNPWADNPWGREGEVALRAEYARWLAGQAQKYQTVQRAKLELYLTPPVAT